MNSVHQKRLKSIFVVHWVIFFLSGCVSVYMYMDQVSNPCILHRKADSFFFFFLQGGFLTTGPPGKPKCMFLHDVCTTLGILNFMGDFFYMDNNNE